MTNTFNVGENVPDSGKYLNIATGKEIWLRKDSVFPAMPMPDQKYRAVLVTAGN